MVNAADAPTTIDFPKFGTVTFAETDLFVFPWGLPGFEHLRVFLVLSLENQPTILWLQSTEDVNVALPMADPWLFFPDYAPKLPTFAILSLELDAPEEFTTMGIVVIPESGPLYMNLMAPVVLNLPKRIGRQVALESGNYSVATQMPEFETVTATEPPVERAEADVR